MSTGPVDRLLRSAARPVHRLVLRPAIRCSGWFRAMQQLVMPTPQESMVEYAMAYVAGSRIEGHYIEFGVAQGIVLANAFHAAERHGLPDMRFCGFDSFEGMPGTDGEEALVAGAQHERGAFSVGVDGFEQYVRDNGVDMDRVKVVPGWFDDVLTEATRASLGVDRAAVVYADCGLYDATLTALNFVTPYVQDGTLVVFGDWFSFRASPQLGQQRAFNEWLAANPDLAPTQFHRFGWHGNSFVLHKR